MLRRITLKVTTVVRNTRIHEQNVCRFCSLSSRLARDDSKLIRNENNVMQVRYNTQHGAEQLIKNIIIFYFLDRCRSSKVIGFQSPTYRK